VFIPAYKIVSQLDGTLIMLTVLWYTSCH